MELSSYRLKQGLNFSMADGASSYAVCIMAAEINSSQQGQGQLKMSMERNKKHIMRFFKSNRYDLGVLAIRQFKVCSHIDIMRPNLRQY